MKVIGWRVWYADGSKYDSASTRWENLPGDGVLVIMLYFDNKTRRIMDGSDWFFRVRHESGEFIYGENNDSLEENQKRYGESISLKRGQWTTENFMRASQKEAMDTKECPCEK